MNEKTEKVLATETTIKRNAAEQETPHGDATSCFDCKQFVPGKPCTECVPLSYTFEYKEQSGNIAEPDQRNEIGTCETDDPETDVAQKLVTSGWIKESIGQYKSHRQVKDKVGFDLYVRRRKLNGVIEEQKKCSSFDDSRNTDKYCVSDTGSSSAMGIPKPKMTLSDRNDMYHPDSCDERTCSLPVLSAFSEYESLNAIRNTDPCLLIGFDSVGVDHELGRDVISWQFSLVSDADLVEFVFISTKGAKLPFMDALGCILDHVQNYYPTDERAIRRYKYCTGWKNNKPVEVVATDADEARKNAKYVYRKGVGFTHELIRNMSDRTVLCNRRDWSWFHTFLDFSFVDGINVCIVCHDGKEDLASMSYGNGSFFNHLTDIQGCLVSLRPMRFAPKSLRNPNNTCVYPVSLTVADTMCHAPADKKTISDLGSVIGVVPVDVDPDLFDQKRRFLADNPEAYMEYASSGSVIALLYASAMYGYNNALPATVTSATAQVVKNSMMKYLGCMSTEIFDRKYRGLTKVKHGNEKADNRPGFVENTSLDPISHDARTIQDMTSLAYHGGYNISSEIGFFPFVTLDSDLKNAFPTAMCLVPDLDWENPIRSEVIRRDLTIEDFARGGVINPLTPFVGYVHFDFPRVVKYPCIPINVDGIPVFPLTSEGMDGVYVAGPNIWLALKLGAHVYCDRGYFLNVRYIKDTDQESRSLASAVRQLVVDRNNAKGNKGQGSLEELILKTMVNSVYGKNAQNVVQKSTWSAYKDQMETLRCSAITNPFSAMMITSVVQAELLAAQNQLHELGYMSCSVTTDGFISNCPEDVLKGLDLYGLRKFMEEARRFLTDGDPELWETKHVQDDLVNFTTRGNVSLHDKLNGDYVPNNPMLWNGEQYAGVCAHNSTKSGFVSDSFEDRLWLMTQVLSRTGTVDFTETVSTSFKDLVHGKPFVTKTEDHHVFMDFDMKRKPIRGEFSTDKVVVNGQEYEIAHFDTEPFSTIEEFRLYRTKKKSVDVLRTVADWEIFWLKIDLNATGAQPRDMEWAILNSCIMGYRSGCWDIPGLNDKTVAERCDWINAHNTSDRKFKESDWKNARRPERLANMLPREMIEAKLEELMNADA